MRAGFGLQLTPARGLTFFELFFVYAFFIPWRKHREKEKEHNKAFYQLCTYMEPEYHQYELDCRLYLTQVEMLGTDVWNQNNE